MPADKWDKFVVADGGDKWDKFVVKDEPRPPAPTAATAKQPAGFAQSFGQDFGAPTTPQEAAGILTGKSGDIEGATDSPYNPPGGVNLPGGFNPGNAVKNVLTNMGQSVANRVKGGVQQFHEAAENVSSGGPILANTGKVLSGFTDIISATNPVVNAGGNAGQKASEGNLPGAAGSFLAGLAQGGMMVRGMAGKPSAKPAAGIDLTQASDIHGAALRNSGGAPAKAAIGETTSTAAPAMLEAADQLGVHSKNVTPAKWAQVSERAIQNQGDAFNGLIKQADAQTPVATETKAAADSLRHEALSERNPNVAAKLNEVADRIEKETTLGGADALRRSLNKETIAHHRKVNVSDANADLVNEANLNAVGKMRDIVYDKTGQQLGIPSDAIQQMKIRESALIRQNDWVQNARKLIENDRLVEKNTGFVNKARYNNQLPNASKGGVTSAVSKSVLGGRDAAFRSQLSKFLDAPRVPVQYPAANPQVANQSRLAGIVRHAGLNQPQTGVPAGAARTPLDEFMRQNPPAYRQPDMGQAAAAWADDPAYPVPAASAQPQFLPRRGNIMLQDIESAGPPPPSDPLPWWQAGEGAGAPRAKSAPPAPVTAAELSQWLRSHGKRR